MGDNLLKLSVLDAGQGALTPKAYGLEKQIETVLLTLEPQWAVKELELDVSLVQTRISGDQDLLGQVWINLLHNAIKFTPSAGGSPRPCPMTGKRRCWRLRIRGL